MIFTLTVVNVSFLDKGVVKSELDLLHTTCMYLQQSALESGEVQILQFDLETNSYSFEKQIKQLKLPVQFGIAGTALGPPSNPYNKIKDPITFQKKQIMFYPEGIISSGTVYLTDRDKKSLYALSNGIAHISHLRKYRYTGKWELIR